MGSNIFFKRDINNIKCPVCERRKTMRRSHSRNLKEKLIIFLTFQKLYRCKECGWRGYKLKMKVTKDSLKTLLLYTFLIFFSILVTKLFLNKFIE